MAEDDELAQAIALSLQDGTITCDEASTETTESRGDELLQESTCKVSVQAIEEPGDVRAYNSDLGHNLETRGAQPAYKRRRSDESHTSSQQPRIPASNPDEQQELVHVDAHHSTDSASSQTVMLAPPGETRRVHLPACVRSHRQMSSLTVEHGSSLSLISKATTLLNLEFNDMDPEADWAKWEALGATIYFFAVLNEDNPAGLPACVLRTVLDGDFSSASAQRLPSSDDAAPSCSRRVIVDYLMTSAAARGRGLAGRLLECARELARISAANLLVLAIEDSCPFWMTHGFVLDDGPINKRINCFPDTHLLKLPTNHPDDFPEPLESDSEEEEDEEEDEERGEDEDEENNQMQQALLASILPSGDTPASASNPYGGCGANDAALAAGVGYPIDLTDERPAQSVETMEQEQSDDEEAQLRLAISLSLDCGAGTNGTGH